MQTHTLDIGGKRLAYDRYGTSGPTLVCVPGIGDTRATWRAFGPILAEAGYQVFALDLRGHGDSDTGFSSYTTVDIGNDVVALLEAEDLHDVVLVGNSIGGGAICHAAVEAPERVRGLVPVNPFVRDMPVERWFRPLVPLLFARPWGAFVWGWYRNTLFVTPAADQSENHAEVVANIGDPARLAAMRTMLRASKADIAARLDQLAVPALLVMGAQDLDYPDPVAEGETLRGLLGGPTEVVVVDQTGHYPQIERPEEVAEAVLGFLGSLFVPSEVRRGA